MLHEMTVPQFTKMLHNLSHLLDLGAKQAEAKKFEMEVLLNSRLAPDQFNLIRQIQISCDTIKLGVSRLTGKEAPKHEDKEKTLPELKSRIESVISFLNAVTREDFKGAEERKISQPRWEGKYLLGHEYCSQHLLPNVYFHITTAYGITGLMWVKKIILGLCLIKAN